MKKLTRVFEEKKYDFIGTHKTKELAEDHKERLKNKGFLVRRVKLKKGHAIYIRKK